MKLSTIMKEYYIIIFKNTHDVINGEKFLKEKDIKVDVMPTPALITQSCGISLKIDSEYIDMVKQFVEQDQLTVKNIYRRSAKGYTQL